SYFVSLTPSLPRSTPFPYTTLFRSPFGNAGRDIVRATALHQLDLGLFKNFRLSKESMKLQFRSEMFNALNHTNFTAANGDRASADRKSTRLNSSHQIISYAVFCLKK